MATKAHRAPRRTQALSKDVIVQVATELLDSEGEDALTLKALTVRLATGYGAIYHHVANRDDLLAAATDDVIARAVAGLATAADADVEADAEPAQRLRALALSLYDAIDSHPWVGAQLTREPWRPALADVVEAVSAQLLALHVPEQLLPDCGFTLVAYILGVAEQNAANARALAASNLDRSEFLADVAARWAQLDPARYPTLHRARTRLADHDDRAQFLAGVNVILAGIETTAQGQL